MNLDLVRSFLVVSELGSLNRAAARLRLSQSTLTRQMRALEQEIGGNLFDRSPAGVALTATGHAFAQGVEPLLAKFDQVLGDARRRARGQSDVLRIGYIMSAAAEYLNPALAALRRSHPEVRVKMTDLSPGEQLRALERGEIDMALLSYAGRFSSTQFYLRRLASLSISVALSEQHALAEKATLALSDLRTELFVGAADADMPGFDRWLVQVCRRAHFRPRLLAEADSLTHAFGLIVAENAVTLLPSYVTAMRSPGVVFRPLKDKAITWDLLLAWQRGRLFEPIKAVLAAMPG